MSNRQYPRINAVTKLVKPHGLACGAGGCKSPAEVSIRVESSYMRGDDEFVNACGWHAKGCRENTRKWAKQFPPGAWHE